MRKILILIGHYLPGYKDGGPIRTIENLVSALSNEYDFYIMCNDRDRGDTHSYNGIVVNSWNEIGKAKVFYVKPHGFSMKSLINIINKMDLVYLCSFYDDYGYKTLFLKKLGFLKSKPVAVASMGVFSDGAMSQKFIKKNVFIKMLKILGLFKNIVWSVTSELEANGLMQRIGNNARYIVAEDLPRNRAPLRIKWKNDKETLSVAFLSRICVGKNLLGAIKALSKVKSNIFFNIYGPNEDHKYFVKCVKALECLPENVKWKYHGDVPSEQVQEVLLENDVFFLPTLGENYGHVIFEALSAGCIPIISDKTPWSVIGEIDAGFIESVDDISQFAKHIDDLSNMSYEDIKEYSIKGIELSKRIREDSYNATGYRKIFDMSLSNSDKLGLQCNRNKKIVHIILCGPVTDGWLYQDNLLPKYHKDLGYDVTVITSELTQDNDGRIVRSTKTRYMNEYGVKLIRIKEKTNNPDRKLKRFPELYSCLEFEEPDTLFVHGLQFLDVDKITKYLKRHNKVKVFVDNHGDFNNSAQNFLSKNILHAVVWKRCAHKLLPYTEKFYGVLPARVSFLKDVYKLPADKCELLLMGADDDEVEKALQPSVRREKRKEYGISDDDILILAGGKIDHNKPQILLLMKAVNEIADKHICLLVFGSVSSELQAEFENQLSNYVKHIGWKTSNEIYSEFAAADLVAFPGLHSVLWEQAVGMGKPCIFRKMQGFTHIDLGGNCMFFEEDTEEEYKRVIKKAIEQKENMKSVAEESGKDVFSYKNIAKRAIEL